MGARRTLSGAARKLLHAASRPDLAAEAQALRDALAAQHAEASEELEQLRAVVSGLQEQLDRWSSSTTASVDGLSERLAALERAADVTRR